VAWCLPLERDGGSPEGCRGWRLAGPLRLFGPRAFFALGCSCAVWAQFVVVCSVVYFFWEGVISPVIMGPIWLSLTAVMRELAAGCRTSTFPGWMDAQALEHTKEAGLE
jgi:hypothetical protein